MYGSAGTNRKASRVVFPSMARPLAALLVLVLLAGCSHNATPPVGDGLHASATTGVLRGVVVDDAIRPLAGVRLEIRQGSSLLHNLTAATDGQFRIGGLAPGSYFITATKAHYGAVQASATIEAGVDNPAALRIQLPFLQREAAFATEYKIRGFMECAGLGGNWCFIANYYPCFAEKTAGQRCTQNLTSDNSYFRLDHEFRDLQRVPDWTQVELAWKSTQSVFDYLQLRVDMVSPALLIDSAKSTYGPTPLVVNLNHTYAAKWSLGVNESMALESFSSGNSACNTNPTAAPYLCILATATVQQDITYYIHAFYGYTPPADWRFTKDGTVPPPPV